MSEVSAAAPTLPSETTAPASDLALLRAYEPILRFTRGELFFPTSVGPYVAQCSLWAAGSSGKAEPLAPAGQLDLERLCEESVAHPDRRLSLRFVQEPLGHTEYARWRRIQRERPSAADRFAAADRFTTTGVLGRLVDAGLRASLLLRGKVPAGVAAAAETIYRERLESDRFTYYGRVVRDGGYICLQYWFFYAMNDWRSTFRGINDHEADWEMITVYLACPSEGPPQPMWAAFSSHDYTGDDLRRRWDDPELQRDGDHVIAFAGAGSHSGAFVPGDYVVLVDPPYLRPVVGLLRRARRWLAPWRHYTGAEPGFGIPYVDYARGDGIVIGPGLPAEWDPAVIDDETPWVRDYRGLWGLDTQDRFGGERAPSGPRYERNGSVRMSWANPLGWAGLQKVAPDDGGLDQALADRVGELKREITELDAAIAAEREALRGLRAQARSLAGHESAHVLAHRRAVEVAEREAELNQRIATRTGLAEERRVHLATISQPLLADPPQAHVRRPHKPRPSEQERRARLLKAWAAISTPLLLSSIILVLVVSPLAWIVDLGIIALGFVGMEAVARRRFISFLGSLILLVGALVLAGAFVVLLLKQWRIALSLLLGVAAIALLLGNLKDLRRR